MFKIKKSKIKRTFKHVLLKYKKKHFKNVLQLCQKMIITKDDLVNESLTA